MPTVDEIMGDSRALVLEGDCREILPTITGQVDHVVTDPPYSRHQHSAVRSSGRQRLTATHNSKGEHLKAWKNSEACQTRRVVELGFEHLSSELRRFCAAQFGRLARRWTLVFSDTESSWLWRMSLEANGLQAVRDMFWDRVGGAPAFTGDRPAAACESITLAHPPGRKRWNGGGKRGIYSFPIVANRLGQRGSRIHTTQKPLELMMALVEDFTSPNDLLLDPFSGSATTAIAALRLGRRCLCIERDPKYAQLSRDRIAAELESSTLSARRAGQLPLLGR